MGRELMSSHTDLLKDKLKELYNAREKVEKEIEERTQALPSSVGLHGPLIDALGYPRADVDVSAVRLHRQRIIMLTNDHKSMTQQLDALLKELHSLSNRKLHSASRPEPRQQQEIAARPAQESMPVAAVHPAMQPMRPFAVVEEVNPGSPASTAELMPGDRIFAFGAVTSEEQSPIQAVASQLQDKRGHALRLLLMRRGAMKELQLVPQQWSGPGLLGARIRPL